MPQKHKPRRLEEIALVAVGSWFKLFGQNFIESKYTALQLAEVRETLFSTVPCYLFDKVAEQVLITVYKLIDENHYRYAELTAVAMHSRIKKLSVKVHCPTIMQHILLTHLCRLTDIEFLHATLQPEDWEPHITEKYFLSGFQSMTKLTTCCLQHITTDAMISALGSNCPALQKLDITHSISVTDCGLCALFRCQHLRELNLLGTSVTSAGFKDLLLNLPGIRDLGPCDYFGSVLEQLNGQISDPLSLVALYCSHMTSEQLKLLTHYCPSLKSIVLGDERNFTHKGDLSILKELQNLQNILLVNYDFFSDCLKKLLEHIGLNLYVLDLVSVKNIDLLYISQVCPNLKQISFWDRCEFAYNNLIHIDYNTLAVSPFSYLKKLECISDCSQVHLELLMSHCKNVKYIQLGVFTPINDAMMSRVFAQNQMKSLEELIIFYNWDLSMQSVELLMTHCDRLRSIAYLNIWKGISSSQIADFRAYISSNNIDLKLDDPLDQDWMI